MIRSRVIVSPGGGPFDRADERLEALARRKVEAAARAAAQVANAGLGDVDEYVPTRSRGTFEGFAAGIRSRRFLGVIFDKGTLGKRTKALKRNRRKDTWTVKRRGAEYTAHRRDIEGKGIAPRNVLGRARSLGRKAMKSTT